MTPFAIVEARAVQFETAPICCIEATAQAPAGAAELSSKVARDLVRTPGAALLPG